MSLITELKRRNVFRVAIAYGLIGWLILQVADTMGPVLGLPEAASRFVFFIFLLGFVPVLLFSWVYEMTPEGLKKESEVSGDHSIAAHTAKKLDMITLLAVLGLAGFLLVDRFVPGVSQGSDRTVTADGFDGGSNPGSDPGSANATPPNNKFIAVLPFANRSNRDDDLFFTDGIHDDLLTQLAKINDLKVISRTSVMAYRGTTKNIAQIASELGVATILEGGVQRAGQRIRINAQLIDVATDEHLWAETFDREMTIDNLFDIQSEITRQIVVAVRSELTPEEQQTLADVPTQSVPAYEAFLRARSILREVSNELSQYSEVESHLRKALELDPDFADALLLSSNVHGSIAWFFSDQRAERELLAREALDRAGELLGTDQPEWQSARGVYLYRFEQDYGGALNALMKAHLAMPGDADILDDLALTQRRLGLFEEAVTSALEAARIDPGSVGRLLTAVGTLDRMGDWSRFEALVEQGIARFPGNPEMAVYYAGVPLHARGDVGEARRRFSRVAPHVSGAFVTLTMNLPFFERDFQAAVRAAESAGVKEFTEAFGLPHWANLNKSHALMQLGDNDAATALLQQMVQTDSNGAAARGFVQALNLVMRAEALALLGENKQAIELAEQATRVYSLSMDKFEGPNILGRQSLVLALAGEREQALELLQRLLHEIPSNLNRWELYLDPRWDFFRDDERFNQLIRPDNFDESMHAKGSGL